MVVGFASEKSIAFLRLLSVALSSWNLDNGENILKDIDSFTEKLQEFKKAITDKNSDKLFQIFNSTKEIRREVIKAGQYTNKSNLVRKKD